MAKKVRVNSLGREMKPSPYGYRDLLSEREFLKVQQRARQLDRGTNLESIKYDEQMLMYRTRSSEYADNGIIYTQRILIEEASFENIIKARNFNEIEKIMRDGGLKVHCNCPAFHFWGYAYKAWHQHYGLVKELRRPIIRNPYGKGYVCKHLYLVLQTFPFYSKELASKFSNYWQGQLKK